MSTQNDRILVSVHCIARPGVTLHESDKEVPLEAVISLDGSLESSVYANAALDVFSSNEAIKVPEDFEFKVTRNGVELHPDPDQESYSLSEMGDIRHTVPRNPPEPRKKIRVKFVEHDSGFCRDYYKTVEGKLYCLQHSHKEIAHWHTCTESGEPDTPLANVDFINIDTNEMIKEYTGRNNATACDYVF